MRSWLGEIPDLWEQLLEPEPEVRDVRRTVLLEDGTEKTEHYDHVANVFPAGPSSYPSRTGPVSGSPDRRLPINTDRLDLTSAGGWPERLDEDQVGHLPVWTTLHLWASSWARLRAMGEAGQPDVPGLCWWMRERVGEVADDHEEFPDAFQAVRKLRGALMAQLGLVDVPDYKRGVPCKNPQCGALTLVHHNGSDRVECESCAALLTFEAFDEWVQHLAAAMKTIEKQEKAA